MPVAQALQIVEDNLGKQFDHPIGLHFLAIGRAGALNHIVGHSDVGIPLHECPMCGPTLLLKKYQKVGSYVYCRNCTGEFVVENTATGLTTRATGNKGNAKDLEAEADNELIQRLVHESARAVFLALPPLAKGKN